MAPTKSRQDLQAKFVRNAIPTEQDFKDLIDAPLNQSDDGIFRKSGEPLSIVAGSDAQRRALRFYYDPPSGATAPDWLISLNPGQDPNDASTNRRGFGIADGTGATRLFLDAAGNLGLGTNDPQAKLHVAGGGARIEGDLSVTGATAFSGSISASGPVTLGKDDGSVDVVMKGALKVTGNLNIGTRSDSLKADLLGIDQEEYSPAGGTLIIGNWTLRAIGNIFQIAYGLLDGSPEKIVAQFDGIGPAATASGLGRFSIP